MTPPPSLVPQARRSLARARVLRGSMIMIAPGATRRPRPKAIMRAIMQGWP